MKSKFKNMILEHMVSRQITIKDMADSTGISESTISRLRNDNIDCRISTILIIADYLDVGLDELYVKENYTDKFDNFRRQYLNQTEDVQDFFNYIMEYKGKGNW